MAKFLGDCAICPKCQSDDTYSYSTDEFELDEVSDKGHANIDYRCKDCGKNFRVCVKFTYNITDSWIR